MLGVRAVVGLILGGALMVGCKKEVKQPDGPAPVVKSQPSTPPMVTSTPTPGTPAAPSISTPGAPAATPNPTSLPALSIPPDPAAAAATNTAKDLLADAGKNVEAKNWDGAGDDFKKLNAMKGQLSPELKDSLETAEAKFVAARAGSGLKLPGLGATPTTAPVEVNK